MNRHAWTARLAAGGVAIIAGLVSFGHIASVASDAGESAWAAILIPFSVDGMILVGVATWLDDAHHGRSWRLSGRLCFWTGLIGTMAANLASAEPYLRAWLISVAAPVAFLLSLEALTRIGRPRTHESDTSDQREPLDPHTEDAISRAINAANLARTTPHMNPREVARQAGVSVRHATRVLAANRPSPNGAGPNESG